jgi:hypothetical protein
MVCIPQHGSRKKLRQSSGNKKCANKYVGYLSPSDYKYLNDQLLEKFGNDIDNTEEKNTIKITKIIKRGKINNENEYRLILNRAEEIYHDKNKKSILDQLNELLAKYDKG